MAKHIFRTGVGLRSASGMSPLEAYTKISRKYPEAKYVRVRKRKEYP